MVGIKAETIDGANSFCATNIALNIDKFSKKKSDIVKALGVVIFSCHLRCVMFVSKCEVGK